MLISCSRFATLVATDLRRAFGEHVRKRACVRVLWVARMRELTGDSGATGVRHCAKFILFLMTDGAFQRNFVSPHQQPQMMISPQQQQSPMMVVPQQQQMMMMMVPQQPQQQMMMAPQTFEQFQVQTGRVSKKAKKA